MALFGVTALVMTSWTCLMTSNSFLVPDSPHVSGHSVCLFTVFSSWTAPMCHFELRQPWAAGCDAVTV